MTYRKARLAISLAVLALLVGCTGKSYVALLESPDGSTGTVYIKGAKGEQVIDRAGSAAPVDGSKVAENISSEQIKRDFGEAMGARPLLPERFLLYFESGGTQLTAESAALLPKIVDNAARRPGVDASIIGHTDTVGTADANTALALRRAKSVAEMILSKGLKVVALTVASHGESNPLIETPDETPEPRNRRVEISLH